MDNVTKLIEQPQPDSFILALRLIFAFVTPVLVGMALIFAARFPLTAERHARLNALLVSRRAGEPETPAQQAEAAALQRELVG